MEEGCSTMTISDEIVCPTEPSLPVCILFQYILFTLSPSTASLGISTDKIAEMEAQIKSIYMVTDCDEIGKG